MKSVVLSNEMSDVSGRKERFNAEATEAQKAQRGSGKYTKEHRLP
jgi:hypothetical protein